MLALMIIVNAAATIHVLILGAVRRDASYRGILTTVLGFMTLGPLTSVNFYWNIGIPEPALIAAMGPAAFGGVHAAELRRTGLVRLLPPGADSRAEHREECRGIHIYHDRRLVTLAGEEMALEPGEYDLLEFLVRRRGRLVDHQELAVKLGSNLETTRTRISAIRKKLGRHRSAIRTQPRYGYEFIPGFLCAACSQAPNNR